MINSDLDILRLFRIDGFTHFLSNHYILDVSFIALLFLSSHTNGLRGTVADPIRRLHVPLSVLIFEAPICLAYLDRVFCNHFTFVV